MGAQQLYGDMVELTAAAQQALQVKCDPGDMSTGVEG